MNNKKNRSAFKIIIMSVATLLFTVLLLFGNKMVLLGQEKTNYNTFVSQVKSKQVEEAEISVTEGKVTYHLRGSTTKRYTNYPGTETFEEFLLTNNVDVKIDDNNWLEYIVKNYSALLLLGVFMFVAMKALNVNVSADIGNMTEQTIKFDDMAGMEEIKGDMRTLAEMLKSDKYKNANIRIPKGVLLEGPPGNGKTMLAKAFAGEAGVSFIAVNASDFGSKFIGVGSDKIKSVFNRAKKIVPCVIFIDELDAVGAKRTAGNDAADKEMNTVLTALLNQMDGFKPMENIMVLAATNRADDLDDALVRPGRFDKRLVVGYPDKLTRMGLFELYTKKFKIDEGVNFTSLARKTYGYSCAKIECAINEAAILSIKNDHEKITIKDFEDAFIQMNIKGHVKEKFERDTDEKTIVAYHEAGHAVIAHFVAKKSVSTITITPTTSGAGGFTITDEKDDNQLRSIADYKNELIMLYGGRAAEAHLRNGVDGATAGAYQDIKRATCLAETYITIRDGIDYSAFGHDGTKKVLDKTTEVLNDSWNNAKKYISKYWAYVDCIAKELIQNETMNEGELALAFSSLGGEQNESA